MRIKSPIIHGFTLLELLLVVTLMAVLAAVALATYDGVADQAKYDAWAAQAKTDISGANKALMASIDAAKPIKPNPSRPRVAGSGTCCVKPRISPPANLVVWILK